MDPDREKAEQSLVAVLNKALRQVPFVRLDCVEDVTAMFADCLTYMESHLELGDSDDEGASEDEEQQRTAAEHKLSSRATSADRRTRDEINTATANPIPALTLPAPPAVDNRGRLGLGGSSTAVAAGAAVAGGDKVPVLPPAGLATKLIGSTVTRDYSSPSQSKRSLGGGAGGKRGSITLSNPVNLSAGGGASSGSTSLSPSSSSSSGASPTSSSSSTPTLPPSASLTASTSSSGSSSVSAGSVSSGGTSGSGASPSSKLGLGLGLKGPGGLMSSNAAGQTQASSSSASNSSPAQPASASGGQSAQSSSSSLTGASGAGAGGAAPSAGGKQIGLGHRPSSRAQYNAAAAAAQSTDEDESKEGASGGSGPSSGQNSDTDEEVIRVARPLGGAPKNKLLHRAAAGLASREYPSPKLGPRSLGASPAGMGPRGMSAPNNQQQGAVSGTAGQQQPPPQLSGPSQRAPTLSHAASTGSAPIVGAGSGGHNFQLASPPSLGPSNSSASDVDVLPEPSSSLREDDSGSALDDSTAAATAASTGGLILTEAVSFVKEKQLSDKEALNIPESAESEEKDLVDEALEKRPDPLQKLRNEVIVAVTASPKQYRSSLRLLTLAAESANNNDGTVTPPDAEQLLPANGTTPPQLQQQADFSSHRLNPLLNAASLPLSASLISSSSPSQSASNTPKPAFLRRLDSPESHHGQLIAAKAKLQMMINRAMQTIPQIKKDALPAVQARLEAALAKLEASTIQP